MITNPTCFIKWMSSKERFILPTSSHKISLWNIPRQSSRYRQKFNSPSTISLWQKKRNPEKQKPPKIPTQTRKAGTGLQMKTNDIIGSLSYIMSIFSISTSGEPIESSNRWLHSWRREKQSNAEATIKRCKKNTGISLKFSWVSGYKITTQMTLTSFSQICKKKATTLQSSASFRPTT